MKHGITRRPCAPALALCAALSLAAAARAETPDPVLVAEAEALYEQANEDMEAQRYDAARLKLERVVRLVPDALGAKLTLAECHESLGRTASAWAQYAAALELARKQGQPDRVKLAADKVAALKPRLATLTIDVPPYTESLQELSIRRDGAPVGRAEWGKPLPVDAGRHEITAAAAGRARWTASVEVAADGARITVTVPPLGQALPGPAAPAEAQTASAEAPGGPRPWQLPLGVGMIGAGGAGLIAAAATLGLGSARLGASSAPCDLQGACGDQAAALRREAGQLTDFTLFASIAGGLVIGAGVVVVLTSPRAASRPGSSLRAALSPRGAAIEWQF
jgi:hypothetical protein